MAIEETRDADAQSAETGQAVDGRLEIRPLVDRHFPVAPGYRVNVRSGPGTNHSIVRVLPLGATVPINGQINGTTEAGPYGTSRIWDNIANGQFISDTFVHTGSDGFVTVRCG